MEATPIKGEDILFTLKAFLWTDSFHASILRNPLTVQSLFVCVCKMVVIKTWTSIYTKRKEKGQVSKVLNRLRHHTQEKQNNYIHQ